MDALKAGKIRKPVVAWVSGTCAKLFKSEVQFGHAGAKSGGQAESAQASCLPSLLLQANVLCVVTHRFMLEKKARRWMEVALTCQAKSWSPCKDQVFNSILRDI